VRGAHGKMGSEQLRLIKGHMAAQGVRSRQTGSNKRALDVLRVNERKADRDTPKHGTEDIGKNRLSKRVIKAHALARAGTEGKKQQGEKRRRTRRKRGKS